jgi:hypothetical protein
MPNESLKPTVDSPADRFSVVGGLVKALGVQSEKRYEQLGHP